MTKYLFLFFLGLWGFTFFSRQDLRSVSAIDPALLKQPVQTPLAVSQPFSFSQNGFEYHVEPRYHYEISGLVTGKFNYRLFNADQYDLIFPYDLCLIWGGNVERRLYQNKSLGFSQDCRFCWARWTTPMPFNIHELSNNHLLVYDKALLALLKRVQKADQVRIKGKLVNVTAERTGKQKQPGRKISWQSSTTRNDGGAGACEVIYVEEMELLKEAHPISKLLFQLSQYGMITIVILQIALFLTASPLKRQVAKQDPGIKN